ncbi:hypothetical protein [Bradyrhizobium sp. S3.2.12]|uniref:hypothetical protein n=1 Tax=Bradyrhizobium sp. S3.2.12 TaxID=3156387 RepID=UPI003392BED1
MNLGSTGSEALDLLIAFVALAVIFYLILRNWHSITTGVVMVGIIGRRAACHAPANPSAL